MTGQIKTTEHWLNALWSRLASAPRRRKDAFRIPAMATVGERSLPQVRQVVLRRACPLKRVIEIHTDGASQKYEGLTSRPHVEFLFWDPRRQLQVRLSEAVELRSMDKAAETWENSPQEAS